MSVEVFKVGDYPSRAASWIASAMEGCSTVVLTGGRTAKLIYPELARAEAGWSGIDVFFSDERCVPPHNPESNYRMATELLLDDARPRAVHRMRGEDEPNIAALLYEEAVSQVEGTFDLVLLGLGGDCHIAGIFPGGPVVAEESRLCLAVHRPDGLEGLTLTPPPLLGGKRIVVITHGEGKAGVVARALNDAEEPPDCPARLLISHQNVTFLIDESAAGAI